MKGIIKVGGAYAPTTFRPKMENQDRLKIRHKGIFLHTDGESAIALHNLMPYRLIERKGILTCGFPERSIDNVIGKMKEARISYEIDWKTEEHPDGIKEEFQDNAFRSYATLREGDMPEKPGSKPQPKEKKRKKDTRIELTQDEKEAYDFLCLACTLGDKKGVSCKMDLREKSVKKMLYCLRSLIRNNFKVDGEEKAEKPHPSQEEETILSVPDAVDDMVEGT